MIPCPTCSRFVRSNALHCPFCDATLRDVPSPVGPAIAGVLLGLALTACGGGKVTGDEGAGSETTAGATTTASTATTMIDDPGTSSSSTMGGTSGDAGVTAYGGPDVDTSPPEDGTASSTIGDTGSGTDTGASSGTAGSSSGQ